jgi:hypothetical protein
VRSAPGHHGSIVITRRPLWRAFGSSHMAQVSSHVAANSVGTNRPEPSRGVIIERFPFGLVLEAIVRTFALTPKGWDAASSRGPTLALSPLDQGPRHAHRRLLTHGCRGGRVFPCGTPFGESAFVSRVIFDNGEACGSVS